MNIPQLSVFIENKPAHLVVPCKLLAEAGINIVTLALSDAERFGVLRLIVREWQRAKEVLEAAGFVVYMYAFTSRLGRRAVLVFRLDDLDAAVNALARAGINPVSPVTLYDHLEEG